VGYREEVIGRKPLLGSFADLSGSRSHLPPHDTESPAPSPSIIPDMTSGQVASGLPGLARSSLNLKLKTTAAAAARWKM